jgi:flagellar basal-body rod modification protein FlgD
MATSLVGATQSLSDPTTSQSASQKNSNSLTSEDSFLKLLVSQIQHQDPLNPDDGVQFLTQLTGFSQLEQLIQINQELAPSTGTTTTSSSANPAGT